VEKQSLNSVIETLPDSLFMLCEQDQYVRWNKNVEVV
jgi:hypothetical protein